MKDMLTAAKAAKRQVAALTTEEKNAALKAMADSLLSHADVILEANALDMEAAKGTVSDVMLDRLALSESAEADFRSHCRYGKRHSGSGRTARPCGPSFGRAYPC